MEHHRKKKKRAHIRLKDDDYSQIANEAAKLGISIPEYIRLVLKINIKKERRDAKTYR